MKAKKKLTGDDIALLTTTKERKLTKDDMELPEEKLGRSHRNQTHTTTNTNTIFAEGKKETNGRVNYRLSIRRLHKEKKERRNEKEVKKDKVRIF